MPSSLPPSEAIKLSDSQLLVGGSRVDITPPLHVPHLGFEPRQGIFEGVHDPLLARAAVFSSRGAHVAVLSADALGLSTDLLGPGRDFIAEVRRRAAEGTDLDPEGILLAATHAHSTPETYGITRIWEREDCAAWIETLADQLASALKLAWRDRRPAQLTCGTVQLRRMNRNRRDDDGPLDESLSVLVAEREDAPPVVLANFACHPVTVQVNPLVSADFPGVATALVERELGPEARCLFLQGAAGDINPIRGHTGEWRDVQTYGFMLGGGILEAIGCARLSEPDQAPVIAAGREVLSLDAREAPPLDTVAAELAEAETALSEVRQGDPRCNERFAEARRLRETYRLAQFGTDPIAAEIQALRIGDLGIAAFPGELFCALGLDLKQQSPAALTMIAECANGCYGYLAPQEAWQKGGYEVNLGAWCRIAPSGPERMVEAAAALLDDLFSA